MDEYINILYIIISENKLIFIILMYFFLIIKIIKFNDKKQCD